MNCLKVGISFACGKPEVSIHDDGDLSFSVAVEKKSIRRCMKAILRRVGGLFASVSAVNDLLEVNAAYAGSKPVVELGLVCMTGLDTECYLQVLDGYLVTIDGCYIKVMKG